MAQPYSYFNPPQQNQNQNSGSNGWDAIDPPEMGATLGQSQSNDRPNSDAWWANYHDQFGRYNAETNPGPSSIYGQYSAVQNSIDQQRNTLNAINQGGNWGSWGQVAQQQQQPTGGQPQYNDIYGIPSQQQPMGQQPMGQSPMGQNQGYQYQPAPPPDYSPYFSALLGGPSGGGPGLNFQLPQGYSNTYEFWSHPNRAQTINNFANTAIPLTQMNQNAYEFDTTRNDQNFWNIINTLNNQYNSGQEIGLSWAGHGLNQQMADHTVDMDNRTFDHTVDMDNRNFGLELNRFGLEDYATRTGLDQSQQSIDNDYDISREINRINDMIARGDIDYQQGQLRLGELNSLRDYTIAGGQLDLGWAGLGQEGQLGNRGLDIEERGLSQDWQKTLLNQIWLREQLAAQERMNAVNATGRDQAPTSRWIRNY